MILAFPPAVPLLEATEVHLVKPKLHHLSSQWVFPPIRPHGAIDLTQLRRLQAS